MDTRTVTDRLAAAGCVAPDLEAAEMLAAAPRGEIPWAWVERRERGEPLAWITGVVWFCGRRLRNDPGVYVPRPQSEELARRAAQALPDQGRALDLCAGAGAIAAHMASERPSAIVLAVDIDERAARCAAANGVPVVVSDLARAVRGVAGFDVVTAVAPYVPSAAVRLLPADVRDHEPIHALDGGGDGLDVARRVVVDAARLLRPGGSLLLEVGGDQDAVLGADLDAAGFDDVETWADEDGDLRGLAATRRLG